MSAIEPFIRHEGLVAPIDQPNVDTDVIIPKQFLKSVRRTGFGPHMFDALRYLDEGYLGQDCSKRPLNPDFSLNQPRYQGASILLTRQNFGCGSSREHAPWAIQECGFRCLIAPSFADIFYNNCFRSGMLPITLPEDTVDRLFVELYAEEGYRLVIDLEACTIKTPAGESISFQLDAFRRHGLLQGLDDIDKTLAAADAIRAFEEGHRRRAPWLFNLNLP